MRRRFHFHGPLRKLVPEPVEFECATLAEGIEGFSRQLPAFRPDPIRGLRRIRIAGFETVESLYAPTDVVDVHVYPQLCFGKNGGLVQIVIGAALIVASVAVFLMNPAAGSFMATVVMPGLFASGVAMIIGGMVQLLAPVPHSDTQENKTKYLPSTQNTTAIGTPIPILYGEHRIGGQILSVNVDAKSIA